MGHVLLSKEVPNLTAPVTGILASTLSVGSSVYLMENGTAVEYLVVNQGIPSASSLYDESCDGLWLLRKDIGFMQSFGSENNSYKVSIPHDYLNNTVFPQYGSIEQSTIRSVKVPFVNGTGGSSVSTGSNGLSTKLFLLSGYEVGFTTSNNSYFPVDGALLSYFIAGVGSSAVDKRIGYYNGEVSDWWLRSPYQSGVGKSWEVYSDGKYKYLSVTNSRGIRPALVLPSNALFDKNTLLLKGVA